MQVVVVSPAFDTGSRVHKPWELCCYEIPILRSCRIVSIQRVGELSGVSACFGPLLNSFLGLWLLLLGLFAHSCYTTA